LGFNRSGIIAVNLPNQAYGKLELLKKELSKHTDLVSVSAAASIPIEWDTKQLVIPEGVNEKDAWNMNTYGVDYGFTEMLGIEVTQGRSFSQNYSDADKFLINEKAVQRLQWENPLGKQLIIGGKKGMVIGVVKDFHFKSLYLEELSPAVLYLDR